MDSSWSDIGSGQHVSYTPTIDLSDDQIHELSTPQAESFFPTPQVEAVAPRVAVTEPSHRVKPVKNIPRREKNYSIKEDELLCSAYINVSKDPINGCNQPTGAYWDRIKEYYHGYKQIQTERSKSSLQHRWEKIQRDTSKFCAHYDSIMRRNESGKNDDDKLKDALELFQGILGYSFPYTHCWLILRNEKKWCDWLASLTGKDNIVHGQEAAPPPQPTEERPMGRDKAKKLRKDAPQSSSSSACLEVLQKMSKDRSVYEERQEEHSRELLSRADRKLAAQERLAAAQERLAAAQEFEQEQRIMSIDVDKVVSWQRDYYIKLQQKIIQKHASGSDPANI